MWKFKSKQTSFKKLEEEQELQSQPKPFNFNLIGRVSFNLIGVDSMSRVPSWVESARLISSRDRSCLFGLVHLTLSRVCLAGFISSRIESKRPSCLELGRLGSMIHFSSSVNLVQYVHHQISCRWFRLISFEPTKSGYQDDFRRFLIQFWSRLVDNKFFTTLTPFHGLLWDKMHIAQSFSRSRGSMLGQRRT